MSEISFYRKKIDMPETLVIFLAAAVVFLVCSYILLRKNYSDFYTKEGLSCFRKGALVSEELMVQKSLFYQKGLDLFEKSVAAYPAAAEPHFLFAEAVYEVAGNAGLARSIDAANYGAPQGAQEMGFLSLAEKEYLSAIARQPTNAIYHQRLGVVYTKEQQRERAEDEFARAVMLDPQNISLQVYLCRYFLGEGRTGDFEIHLLKAVELDKNAYSKTSWEMQNFLKSVNREDLITR